MSNEESKPLGASQTHVLYGCKYEAGRCRCEQSTTSYAGENGYLWKACDHACLSFGPVRAEVTLPEITEKRIKQTLGAVKKNTLNVYLMCVNLN